LDHGAEIHGHERLVDWERRDGHFVLRTDRGAYEAGQIVFTTGAWIGKMLRVPVEAERNVLGWFSVGLNAATFAPSRLPVWIVDSEAHGHFYGFPVHGVPGFKLGRLRHTPLPGVDPDLPREEVCAADEADLRQFVAKYFPAANGPVLSMITCFFENSPDRAPIIDSIPDVPGAWVVGGFSGHGFKYSSAIGEVVRDLVTRAESAFDLTRFRASRFHP